MHILIPQLENSMRHVLNQQGVETTTLNQHGVQERWRFGAILQHEKTLATFGEDVTLDLQALLIEPRYGNLRNEITHGFMRTEHFFQATTIYLWWLIFRLCLTPFYNNWSTSQAESEVEVDGSNSDTDGASRVEDDDK